MKKKMAEMTPQELALLSALSFVGRIGTNNPPSEWDRQNALRGLRTATRPLGAHRAPYYKQFFSRKRAS